MLDVEPILPGEDECAAALRLLGRIRRLYGPRFFDGISADAWYAKGPFLRALDKLGWLWVVVLKRQDMDVFKETLQLSKTQKANVEFRDESRQRQVQLWQVKDLHFSDGYTQGSSVQVVRSEERLFNDNYSSPSVTIKTHHATGLPFLCVSLFLLFCPNFWASPFGVAESLAPQAPKT